MNIFKKIKEYTYYKKTLSFYKNDMREKLNIQFDWIGRPYVVISIDEEEAKKYALDFVNLDGVSFLNGQLKIENVKSLQILSDSIIDRKLNIIKNYFVSIGLSEHITIIKRVNLDYNSKGFGFGYKFFNEASVLTTTILLSLVSLITFLIFF